MAERLAFLECPEELTNLVRATPTKHEDAIREPISQVEATNVTSDTEGVAAIQSVPINHVPSGPRDTIPSVPIDATPSAPINSGKSKSTTEEVVERATSLHDLGCLLSDQGKCKQAAKAI